MTPQSLHAILELLPQGAHRHNLRELAKASDDLAETSPEHLLPAVLLKLGSCALADMMDGEAVPAQLANEVHKRFAPTAERMLQAPSEESLRSFAEAVQWALKATRAGI